MCVCCSKRSITGRTRWWLGSLAILPCLCGKLLPTIGTKTGGRLNSESTKTSLNNRRVGKEGKKEGNKERGGRKEKEARMKS